MSKTKLVEGFVSREELFGFKTQPCTFVKHQTVLGIFCALDCRKKLHYPESGCFLPILFLERPSPSDLHTPSAAPIWSVCQQNNSSSSSSSCSCMLPRSSRFHRRTTPPLATRPKERIRKKEGIRKRFWQVYL